MKASFCDMQWDMDRILVEWDNEDFAAELVRIHDDEGTLAGCLLEIREQGV